MAGVVLVVVGLVVHRLGARVGTRVLPPAVTGAVVMLSGFNLATVAGTVYWAQDQTAGLVTMVVTMAAAVLLLRRPDQRGDRGGLACGRIRLGLALRPGGVRAREGGVLGLLGGGGEPAVGHGVSVVSSAIRGRRAQRSTSPNTMSSVPSTQDTSARRWPRHIQSIA